MKMCIKKTIPCVAAVVLLAASAVSCNVITNTFGGLAEAARYKDENDPNAFSSIELKENDNMNRLSFGTSSGAAPGSKVTVNSDGTITVYAHNAGSNEGKIAGSEDGLAFYFKEVDAGKNFRLSADVTVGFFGLNGKDDLNGQEGFGLMARDYVPQYPGYTMQNMKDVSADGSYYAGSTGGTGNMIMVGGVKRGMRVYWRTGVTDPTVSGETEWSPDGEGDCIYDNDSNKIADASKAVFEFRPKELPDYSIYPTMPERPDYAQAGSKYNLLLEKNNSGFRVVITPPAGKGGDLNYRLNPYDINTETKTVAVGQPLEYFIPEPEMLFSINKNHYYVGFFAARSAEATFSNIVYEEADVEDCAPRVESAPLYYTPTIEVYSPSTSSTPEYTLHARANVEGTMAVSLNGVKLPDETVNGEWKVEKSNASAIPYTGFSVPVTSLKEGSNVFQMAFYPDKIQNNSGYLLASTDAIVINFIVNRKSYGNGIAADIYVSPNGRQTNAGTRESPLNLETAISYVQPGQTIIMMDGIYSPLQIVIPRGNSGKPNPDVTAPTPSTPDYKADLFYNNHKVLKAENRDRAIIDFLGHAQNRGFELRGDYWVISGIHVRGTAPAKRKGLTIFGNYNRVEWVKTYLNGDSGLQISGESNEPKALWPANNVVAYCESFYNKDEAREDADGFAAKLTVGEGNLFEWCVAHHNVDDGWDLFAKKETGAIGAVIVENSIAYKNGYYLPNYPGSWTAEYANSGGNGFKMGGEGISVTHHLKNCLAFMNGADGITSNSNPALLCTNVTAVDNTGRGFAIYGAGTSDPAGLDAKMVRLLSMYSDTKSHSNDGVWWNTTATNPGYIWRDNKTQNREGSRITMEYNIVSASYNFLKGLDALADAPFQNEISGGIKGIFIERETNEAHAGKFVLNEIMKIQNINVNQPGAVGLYY